MNAITRLVQEHDSILKMIRVTRSMLEQTNCATLRVDHLEQVIDFIRNFADKYHHLKEEDVLFVEMVRHGMTKENGPIGVMLHEHDEGRQFIAQAVGAVERYKDGDAAAFGIIRENLLNYCVLLTQHIAKENNILYPMAERLLPVNVLETMTKAFETSVATTVNNEYEAVYLKRVETLAKLYLNE